MAFDEEPERDPHGECAKEIKELKRKLAWSRKAYTSASKDGIKAATHARKLREALDAALCVCVTPNFLPVWPGMVEHAKEVGQKAMDFDLTEAGKAVKESERNLDLLVCYLSHMQEQKLCRAWWVNLCQKICKGRWEDAYRRLEAEHVAALERGKKEEE